VGGVIEANLQRDRRGRIGPAAVTAVVTALVIAIAANVVEAFAIVVTVPDATTRATRLEPAVESLEAATSAVLDLAMGVAAVVVCLLAVAWFLASLHTLAETVVARQAHPVTTVGTMRSVETVRILEAESYEADDEAAELESVECITCGVSTRAFERVEWRQERIVAGFVVDVLEEGVHHDCLACADDPVVASLRAQADDPESIDDLDELVVDEEPGADLEDLDDEQLDEALGWIDMGADVNEAVREVSG
jgi:hypothetical protein